MGKVAILWLSYFILQGPVSSFLVQPSSYVSWGRRLVHPDKCDSCIGQHLVSIVLDHNAKSCIRPQAPTAVFSSKDAECAETLPPPKKRRLLGAANFKHINPKTDRFKMEKFHHIEFYCGDATNTARRFMWGLGMPIVAKSDQSTGNTKHASYVVQSNDLRFVFTAPYSIASGITAVTTEPTTGTVGSNLRVELEGGGEGEGEGEGEEVCCAPFPGFDAALAHDFFRKHGLGGRAIGIEVEDSTKAYNECVTHGGIGVLAPTVVHDEWGQGSITMSEVHAYGDVVLRFIAFDSSMEEGTEGAGEMGKGVEPYVGPFLPNFYAVPIPEDSIGASTGGLGVTSASGMVGGRVNCGLQRLDHAVGNVWDLLERVDHIAQMTGMHKFAEFAAEDVGTVDSGLNSIVLASNNEMVLLPLNEPTFGTPRKSQIQTYLEQNNGPGLQHLALKTDDIFSTMRCMRERSLLGGFEFMDRPEGSYYKDLPGRVPGLTEEQYKQVEELGLLVDNDDEGILVQIFTRPVGDRPTFFLEIIQRIGCMYQDKGDGEEGGGEGEGWEKDGKGGRGGGSEATPMSVVAREKVDDVVDMKLLQRGGCGGFGTGNFKALFESIENYEMTLSMGATEVIPASPG